MLKYFKDQRGAAEVLDRASYFTIHPCNTQQDRGPTQHEAPVGDVMADWGNSGENRKQEMAEIKAERCSSRHPYDFQICI